MFLLDPTLNQRKDFAGLLRLLAECNPGHRFTYFGELRGEGITEETAVLLRAANFSEVEVGLQSIDPDAMILMDRRNNLRAFERGVRARVGQHIALGPPRPRRNPGPFAYSAGMLGMAASTLLNTQPTASIDGAATTP